MSVIVQDGVNWLAFLARYQLHGILCDDMGLGKTLQALCILATDHYHRSTTFKVESRSHIMLFCMFMSHGRCYLSSLSSHLQKTTKTASVSTFIRYPSLVNYCYSVWSLW